MNCEWNAVRDWGWTLQGLQSEMRQAIRELADQLLLKAATDLPADVALALKQAEEREPAQTAKAQLKTILKNIDVSRARHSSICQDPGIISFDVTVGSKFPLDFDLREVLRDATEHATRSIPLRQNICHPLTKKNTTTNTGYGLPIVNYDFQFGKDYLEIWAQLRGGGSAFRSGVYSLAPTAPRVEGIKKLVFDHVTMAGGIPCPPTVVGVGLGGNPDNAMNMAFRALRRVPVGSPNPDGDMADLEKQILAAINSTGIGTMGLGGSTTALAVHIEYCGSHIATHPVAIAFSCWADRFAGARIDPTGKIQWITRHGGDQ
jgi:tartrate/fumarate subfamily iron-sulfur-dependent hydro-lyase alpha chain